MESESESESEVRKPTRMKVHFESSVVVPEQAFEAAQTFYQAAFSFRETFTINDHKMYKKGRNSLCLRWTRFDDLMTESQEGVKHFLVKGYEVEDAMVKVVASGYGYTRRGEVGFTCRNNSVWPTKMGMITDPFGYRWAIHARSSATKTFATIWCTFLAALYLYVRVWQPVVQPAIETVERVVQPAIETVERVVETGQRVAGTFEDWKAKYNAAVAEAERRYGDIQRDEDSTIAAFWNSFR